MKSILFTNGGKVPFSKEDTRVVLVYATNICGILVFATDILSMPQISAAYTCIYICGIHKYDSCIFIWEWKEWKNNVFITGMGQLMSLKITFSPIRTFTHLGLIILQVTSWKEFHLFYCRICFPITQRKKCNFPFLRSEKWAWLVKLT